MKSPHNIKKEFKLLQFVWNMAQGEHGKIVSTMLIGFLSALLPAILTYLIKSYVDRHALDFTAILNTRDLIIFFSIIIGSMFLKLLSQFITGHTMPNIKRNVEINCVKKFSSLPYSHIFRHLDQRTIMALSIESGMIASLIPMTYHSFIKAPITILGFVILLLFSSPLLTLICFALISIIVIGVLLFRKSIKRLNKALYDRIGDLHQHFSEWLNGYKVFILSGATRFAEKRLLDVSVESATLSKKITKVNVLQSLIIEIITIAIVILFVRVISLHFVPLQTSGLGELILFPTAILFIRGEVLKIIYGYMQLAGTESATKRMINIIGYTPEEQAIPVQLNDNIETLTLKNLTFSYADPGVNIFKSVNITLKKGEVNTIIGRSGSGKTTLINLCMRLYTPDSGSIFYNNQELRSISSESLFQHIALVEQDPFVFEGSLAENIFFDKRPDIGYVLELLEQFDLSHLAQNESELHNTYLGVGHRHLSTGEKQRIAIIRAVVQNADVIFFDEVTSNLDDENSQKIIQYIRELSKEKLVVCVSHDLMLMEQSTQLYKIKHCNIECV